jgi:hypothetical protein
VDTSTVPLAELTPANTEVVGLNGKVAGHCGYSLPVVKYTPKDLYCVLSITRKPGPLWTDEAKVLEMRAAGRVTLFKESNRFPDGWSVGRAQQPVVVWAPSFLTNGTMRVPQHATRFLLSESVQVLVCPDVEQAESWLSEVASKAQVWFDNLLAKEPRDWASLSHVAELGGQAAREAGQRYWAYVRRAVALYFQPDTRPELAYQLFRGVVEPTYTGVTWRRFLEGMTVVYERGQYVRQEARVALSRVEISPELSATSQVLAWPVSGAIVLPAASQLQYLSGTLVAPAGPTASSGWLWSTSTVGGSVRITPGGVPVRRQAKTEPPWDEQIRAWTHSLSHFGQGE